MAQAFDLVIRGGTIIDGTGVEGYVADVAVNNGVIAKIGKVGGVGKEEIDAKGQIVTPGFVDIHTHYDGQATWDNRMSPSSHHGITTAVMGNCGVGFAPCRPHQHDELIKLMDGVEDIPDVVLAAGVPWQWETFPQYLDFLGQRQFDIDIGAYVPHAAVRVFAMGERGLSCEPATAEDIVAMGRIVKEGVAAGALGFGTSRVLFHQTRDGRPIPTLKSSREELLGLAGAMNEVKSGVVQFVGMFEDRDATLAELRNIVEVTGRPVTFAAGAEAPEMLEFLKKAHADGLPITGQIAPRATSFMISHEMTLHPFCTTAPYKALAHMKFDEKIAELRKPQVRAAIIDAAPQPNAGSLSSLMRDFTRIFVLGDPPNYEPAREDSMAAIAARGGIRPEELTYDVMLERNGRNLLYGAFAGYDAMSLEAHVNAFRGPNVVPSLGDGGAHCATICDASYSTFMLAYMARDRKGAKLPVELVVRALCQNTAQMVGLHDRGRLLPGYRADINVIDFDRLNLHAPHLVWDLPAGGKRLMQNADGYTATIVNGQITYREGKATKTLPGRLIRGAQSAPAA